MKKKLLVLLIAASSMLMPNLASAIAIDVEDDVEDPISKEVKDELCKFLDCCRGCLVLRLEKTAI